MSDYVDKNAGNDNLERQKFEIFLGVFLVSDYIITVNNIFLLLVLASTTHINSNMNCRGVQMSIA
jgi:hypothetical protein